MSQGFIKLNRDIRGTWIHKDPLYFRAYCDILMTVNYTECKTVINGKTLVCHVDESLLSLESWAQLFGNQWNKGKVRRFFDRLKKQHVISTIPDTKTTRLKVLKSARYKGQQHDNSTIIARYPTPIEEGKKERSTTTGENEDFKEPKPYTIDDARLAIERQFGKPQNQVKAIQEEYKNQTGFEVDAIKVQQGIVTFLQKGMEENYKGRIKDDEKVKSLLLRWITNQKKFDYTDTITAATRKQEKEAVTLEQHIADNYKAVEIKHFKLGGQFEKWQSKFEAENFKYSNIAKGYSNPKITAAFLFEVCFLPYGKNIGGTRPEMKLKTFERFFEQSSNYNQNKGDVRKLFKEYAKVKA